MVGRLYVGKWTLYVSIYNLRPHTIYAMTMGLKNKQKEKEEDLQRWLN
jgi:hypothetical protein